MAEGVTISEPWVHDNREVTLKVEGAPELYTPAGKAPIDPYSVRLSYDIAEGRLRSITVLGRTWDGTLPNARWARQVNRRVDPDRAPSWLLDIVQQFRPTYMQETTDQ